MKRVAVLGSGRGSNLEALLRGEAEFGSYRVALVVSNIEDAGILAIAEQAGRRSAALPHRGRTREAHESEVLTLLRAHGAEIVCLAGYMRVLTPQFIASTPGPILNIHPSLLPSFPGMNAQRQAIVAGVRWSGATVHLVDPGVDTGAILLQEPVEVMESDTEATLSARILLTEHRLYPRALDLVARDRVRLHEGRAFIGEP